MVHINSAGLADTPVMLEMISDARAHGRDVTTEAYPYDAGMTEIQSATIQDVYKTAPDGRLAEVEWPRTGERLNRESFERYSRIGGPVVIHTNTEQMVAVAISSPLTIIASDAYWQDGTGHPRTAGTFARVLGRYVRETHALSLMDAIRKMTLMPAQRLEASLDVPRAVAVAGRHSARDRERCVRGRERAGSRGRRARNSGTGGAATLTDPRRFTRCGTAR